MTQPVSSSWRHTAARLCLASLCAVALTGCAGWHRSRAAANEAPPPPAQAPAGLMRELQGQLSLKLQAFGTSPAKGLSLGFFYTGDAQTGRLDLITLMGSQLAQVTWTQNDVWLEDEKGRHRYESMAQLSAAVLGEALPLQALTYWMQGEAAPAWPSQPLAQAPGFTQLGWHIDLSELGVKKLTATRTGSDKLRGVFVKVYLDR